MLFLGIYPCELNIYVRVHVCARVCTQWMTGYFVKVRSLLKAFQAGRDLIQEVSSFCNWWKRRREQSWENLPKTPEAQESWAMLAAHILGVGNSQSEHTSHPENPCLLTANSLHPLAATSGYPGFSYFSPFKSSWKVFLLSLPGTLPPPATSISCISWKAVEFGTHIHTPASEMRPWEGLVHYSEPQIASSKIS